jgi:hypothetical protein
MDILHKQESLGHLKIWTIITFIINMYFAYIHYYKLFFRYQIYINNYFVDQSILSKKRIEYK